MAFSKQCQSEIPNIDPSKWPGLILSLSTTRLLMEEIMLPLCQIYDSSNKENDLKIGQKCSSEVFSLPCPLQLVWLSLQSCWKFLSVQDFLNCQIVKSTRAWVCDLRVYLYVCRQHKSCSDVCKRGSSARVRCTHRTCRGYCDRTLSQLPVFLPDMKIYWFRWHRQCVIHPFQERMRPCGRHLQWLSCQLAVSAVNVGWVTWKASTLFSTTGNGELVLAKKGPLPLASGFQWLIKRGWVKVAE